VLIERTEKDNTEVKRSTNREDKHQRHRGRTNKYREQEQMMKERMKANNKREEKKE